MGLQPALPLTGRPHRKAVKVCNGVFKVSLTIFTTIFAFQNRKDERKCAEMS
jgi:hypothetical protein